MMRKLGQKVGLKRKVKVCIVNEIPEFTREANEVKVHVVR